MVVAVVGFLLLAMTEGGVCEERRE
jgi:hypothetical protein